VVQSHYRPPLSIGSFPAQARRSFVPFEHFGPRYVKLPEVGCPVTPR
jgi:hypothetical protein